MSVKITRINPSQPRPHVRVRGRRLKAHASAARASHRHDRVFEPHTIPFPPGRSGTVAAVTVMTRLVG